MSPSVATVTSPTYAIRKTTAVGIEKRTIVKETVATDPDRDHLEEIAMRSTGIVETGTAILIGPGPAKMRRHDLERTIAAAGEETDIVIEMSLHQKVQDGIEASGDLHHHLEVRLGN